MSLFRVTLDGNLLSDEPEGLMDFVSELKRDKSIGGQVLLVDLTLKFKGGTDGYIHLKPLIDCQGFCASSEIQIEESCNNDDTWVEIFDGIIFYTDIKEHLFSCILECQLTDNSFFAKIDNNKNVEAFVNVGRSKNDVAFIAPSGNAIQFFDVVTGTYTASVRCWSVWHAFNFIINYMSDATMGFVSDFFFTGGEMAGLDITTGEQIRLGNGGAPTKVPFFSFETLFTEVNKKMPIAFSIETIAGVKTMRIEPQSYFFDAGTSVTLNDVKGIVKSVDTSQLYSRVKLGSSEWLEYSTGVTDFPHGITLLGYKEESYAVTGICNIDNTLDLVSEWIIDSNVIQDVFSNGNTGYDDDIFFIMTDAAVPQAIQTDVFQTGGAPLFYNDALRNVNTAIRWLGGIPNSIAIYQGSDNDEFMASSTSDVAASVISLIEPFAFQDDFNPPNFDTNNRYDNGTFRYTAPATGIYSFETVMSLDILSVTFCNPAVQSFGYNIDFTLVRYDAANNLIETVVDFHQITSVGTHTITSGYSVYLNATDYVVIRIFTTGNNMCVPLTAFWRTGCSFACTATVTGGGQFAIYSPEDFKAYKYEIKNYPLTFAQYQTIIANPLKQVAFNDGADISGEGWIENKKYHHINGTADFILTKSLPKITCE